jgi:hypothetical protein
MVELIYDATQLHPEELLGIMESESTFCGLVNNYPIGRKAVPYEPIDLYAGDDRTIRIYVKTPDLNIVDLTGATGVLTIKMDKLAVYTVISKSTAVSGQGAIGVAEEGELLFYIVPGDTDVIPIRQYVFDVRITLLNLKTYTVLEGVINLQKSIG